MSDSPRCIARLQIQANATMCQNVYASSALAT